MRMFGKAMLAFGLVALMSGSAFAQGRGFGGGFGGGAMLLTNKSVHEELKVTDDQASKLQTLGETLRDKQREAFQDLQNASPDERRAKMQEMAKTMATEIDKGLAEILKPEQTKRFHQISTQQASYMALSQPRVVEALKLTDDQKSKLASISEEAGAAMREIFQSAQGDREGAMQKMQELRKETMTKASALLTEDQKKAWKDLIGAPFEVRIERRPN